MSRTIRLRVATLTRSIKTVLLGLLLLAGCSEQHDSTTARHYPNPDSPGARLLLAKCSGCHVAPFPQQHTVQEWPAIVQLMQQRSVSKGSAPISDGERNIIVDYLKRHAGVSK